MLDRMRVLAIVVTLVLTPSLVWSGPLTIEDCIHLAFAQNPYLKQYQASLRATKPLKWEAFSGFLPEIHLENDLSRRALEDVSPYYSQEFQVVLNYNLFAGGKTLHSFREAGNQIGAAQERVRQAMVETAYQVADAFYTVVEKREMVKAARDDLKDAQTNLDLAEARFKQGLSPYADVIKAKAVVANAKYKLTNRQKEYYVAEGELNMEMGKPIMEKIEVVEDLGNNTGAMPSDFEEIASEGRQRNPYLKEIAQELEAEKNRKRQVYSEFLPSLDFNWYYGWHDTSFPANDYKEWEWMLTLKIPLFSGFASRARLAREKALVQSLEHRLDWERLTVTQEMWKAFQEVKASKANVVQSKAYLDSAQEDMRITRGRYKEGLANMVDLITSQASLSLARAKHISSMASYKQALVALEKAMGRVPVLERGQ